MFISNPQKIISKLKRRLGDIITYFVAHWWWFLNKKTDETVANVLKLDNWKYHQKELVTKILCPGCGGYHVGLHGLDMEGFCGGQGGFGC